MSKHDSHRRGQRSDGDGRTDGDEFVDGPLLEGIRALPDGAFGVPEPSASFREALRERTSGVVRRRGLRWRYLQVAGVAAVFLVGVWTGSAIDGSGGAPEEPLETSRGEEQAGGGGEAVSGPPVALAVLPDNPLELDEQVAVADSARRAEILRQAGDGYLAADRMDPEAALYCYRQLLAQPSTPASTEPQPGDSWLLVQLKLARRDGDQR